MLSGRLRSGGQRAALPSGVCRRCSDPQFEACCGKAVYVRHCVPHPNQLAIGLLTSPRHTSVPECLHGTVLHWGGPPGSFGRRCSDSPETAELRCRSLCGRRYARCVRQNHRSRHSLQIFTDGDTLLRSWRHEASPQAADVLDRYRQAGAQAYCDKSMEFERTKDRVTKASAISLPP